MRYQLHFPSTNAAISNALKEPLNIKTDIDIAHVFPFFNHGIKPIIIELVRRPVHHLVFGTRGNSILQRAEILSHTWALQQYPAFLVMPETNPLPRVGFLLPAADGQH